MPARSRCWHSVLFGPLWPERKHCCRRPTSRREYVIRSTQHAETVVGISGEVQAKQVADIELEVRSVCQTNKTSANLRDVVIQLTALKMNVQARRRGNELRFSRAQIRRDRARADLS